ncbi:MAG: RagB/SusD family nutrient uptake outer membrane protein [Chitinophagaceae bacterium]
MKKHSNILSLALLARILTGSSSCQKDFLKETLKTDRSTEFAKTDKGILQIAAGTYYQAFSVPKNGEWFYCDTNYGKDEFLIGGDPSNSPWNNYDQTFNSIITVVNGNTAAANFQWDELYKTIGNANLLIENANKSTSTSTAIKNTSLGEGLFFRAYS